MLLAIRQYRFDFEVSFRLHNFLMGNVGGVIRNCFEITNEAIIV